MNHLNQQRQQKLFYQLRRGGQGGLKISLGRLRLSCWCFCDLLWWWQVHPCNFWLQLVIIWSLCPRGQHWALMAPKNVEFVVKPEYRNGYSETTWVLSKYDTWHHNRTELVSLGFQQVFEKRLADALERWVVVVTSDYIDVLLLCSMWWGRWQERWTHMRAEEQGWGFCLPSALFCRRESLPHCSQRSVQAAEGPRFGENHWCRMFFPFQVSHSTHSSQTLDSGMSHLDLSIVMFPRLGALGALCSDGRCGHAAWTGKRRKRSVRPGVSENLVPTCFLQWLATGLGGACNGGWTWRLNMHWFLQDLRIYQWHRLMFCFMMLYVCFYALET